MFFKLEREGREGFWLTGRLLCSNNPDLQGGIETLAYTVGFRCCGVAGRFQSYGNPPSAGRSKFKPLCRQASVLVQLH